MNTNIQLNKVIRYRRFLNGTLQAKKLRKEICDEFTRKIFDYLEAEPLFDSQVFCAFLYHFIFRRCVSKRHLIMSAETNDFDKIRLYSNEGAIANELSLFLGLHSIRFALSSVDSNQFHNVSIEEKLKHLLANNNPSWKAARVKIILPENGKPGNIVPYFDLEFTLPRLSTEQKLDIIHFAICALNYLSQKDDSAENFLENFIEKHEHLKIISDNLIRVRDSVIDNALRDKEGYGDELEFDESLPDIARILTAQTQDPQIEKQWLEGNPIVSVEPEAKTVETNLDKKLKSTLSARQWLIAMSFFTDAYKLYSVTEKINFSRLLTILNNGKNLQAFRTKLGARDLITTSTITDAQEVANLFRELNLSQIAEDIEAAINKTKARKL